MPQPNWARIYSTSEIYKADMVRVCLEDEGIQCVVVDKKDSAYGGTFGEVEIYVQPENVIRAKHIVNKKDL